MFCKNCGQEISNSTKFCPHCGCSVQNTQNMAPINVVISNTWNANATAIVEGSKYSTKNRWLALILCLFLGWLGIHRFYLGKIPTGILFLVTFGLGFIGVIWDLIMLIMNNAKDGKGLPLR